MKLLLAIDPGSTGAIAFKYGNEFSVEDIPTQKIQSGKSNRTHIELRALVDLLRSATLSGAVPAVALIEKVHANGKNGSIANFSLGESFGILQAILAVLDIEIRYVSPQAWKKELNLDSDKESSRAMALQLYPQLADRLKRKKDHNRAEALLLLNWMERNG